MASSAAAFSWNDANFRKDVTITPLKLLVAPTPLVNKDFSTAITSGVSTVKHFISDHNLDNQLLSPSYRIDNFPVDPGSDGSPLIEPGYVLKDDADIAFITDLLTGQSKVALRMLPADSWMEYRLHGSYSQLPQACGQLFERVFALGHRPCWNDGGFHQHYVTYPPDVEEEGLITDIRVRVAPTSS